MHTIYPRTYYMSRCTLLRAQCAEIRAAVRAPIIDATRYFQDAIAADRSRMISSFRGETDFFPAVFSNLHVLII